MEQDSAAGNMKIQVLSSVLRLWQTFRNGFMKLEHTERWP